ncbi:type VII secretion protein EssC [Clostridium sporogenes]
MKRVFIFNDSSYIEYPLTSVLELSELKIVSEDEKVTFIGKEKQESVKLNTLFWFDNTQYLILDQVHREYDCGNSYVLIGEKNCDIELTINAKFVLDKDKLINDDSYPVYVNGVKKTDKTIPYKIGDFILIKEVLFTVYRDYVSITGSEEKYGCNLALRNLNTIYFEGFPEYKRSPRVIKRVKNDKITILKPPTKISRKKGSLAKVIIPPLSMACVVVLMSIFMRRGIFVLVSLAGTLITLIFSVTTFFSENKELKENNLKRKKMYENYLLDMRKKLNGYRQNEIDALNYNNLDIHLIEDMVNHYNPRIYERDVNDDDFLAVCVGRAKDSSEYQVVLDYDALEIEKDDLLEEAKEIYSEYQYIDNKPVLVDLKKAHLGIVGEKKEVHQQIKNILAQITFFQSYHDVQIVMLYNEKYIKDFDYIKWYPHVKIHAINLTGNINNERVRDQVLGSLHQILKDRKIKRDENKREMSYYPHFIVVVDDYHLIMNHSIMEHLQEPSTDLGFSLIYTAQKRGNLPENIKTVLLMEDSETATLLLNEGTEVNKRMEESQLNDINLETMARNLCSIKHFQGVTAHIPENITFFDMYKVKKPEELNIKERWAKGDSHKSLAVPIGVRAKDDYVELNLHEKAHGPHGLVAGTTGSGKSEIIQSYILSLAVNFSPYEVGFLLIDYKGGGMANLFKKLPHLLGTITNLDGAESMRALASIKSELARRQKIFNKYEVNNINKYNKLFKQGKAKEPLPHLFIISDEFAELKKEQPEFMTELVSVARIGRTLGVHLILATQKPTGVVDDQIWSNSKFKLALKVQDASDSKEIIKTPDASFITLPGRAYLQVGNNEIYELFQSAWSGATYNEEEESEKIDNRIYKINLLGQCELINQDLSEGESESYSMVSQLDAIVNHIHDLYDGIDHLEITKPWLPSLEDKIISPYIKEVTDLSLVEEIDLNAAVGLMDIPESQAQEDYYVNFVQDGNLAVFSSSGFGKSFTLGTIITSLAIKNNPKYLNFYILDFGNSSLIPYKGLPHTADYMTFDSEEKLKKFKSLIEKEIKRRKQLFGQKMAQNYDMYNKMHPEDKMKAIVIFIDNFDVVKEISMEFEDFIMKMTRDGFGLGIYTIISATRMNAVRFATLNNFKKKIVQYLFDDGDVISLLGRSPYKLNEKKGRALVKNKIVSMMQVYSPVEFEDDVEYMKNLKAIIHDMNSKYTGEKVFGIPILPEIFTTKDFANYGLEGNTEDLVGLSLEDVRLVSADITGSPYVIIGPVKSGKTNLLEIIMNQGKGPAYLFDSSSLDLYKYKNSDKVRYIETEDEVKTFIEDLVNEIQNRKNGLTKALEENTITSPKEYYSSLPAWSVYIDDADIFIERIKNFSSIFNVLNDAATVDIKIIATVQSTKLKGFDDLTKYFKNTTYGAVLGSQGTVNLFPLSSMRDVPVFGYGVLFNNGNMRKVKIPKYIGF